MAPVADPKSSFKDRSLLYKACVAFSSLPPSPTPLDPPDVRTRGTATAKRRNKAPFEPQWLER
eukprot:210172-Alexandrium_andersonii.AAC.1